MNIAQTTIIIIAAVLLGFLALAWLDNDKINDKDGEISTERHKIRLGRHLPIHNARKSATAIYTLIPANFKKDTITPE